MPDGKKPDKTGGMQVDPELVRELAELLDATRLTEIEVQDGDRRIRVTRKVQYKASAAPWTVIGQATGGQGTLGHGTLGHGTGAPQAAAAPAGAAGVATAADELAAHPGAVRSPMVGTAYLAAEPGGKPLVTVGSQVSEGDTLLIVEAMKVMNPIAAPRSGRVSRILVEDEQPVEYDQLLVMID